MNGLPDSSQPKFEQEVHAYWWSPTAPDGEEFELPSGTKTCSRLKVRFVEEIIWVDARVGPVGRLKRASLSKTILTISNMAAAKS